MRLFLDLQYALPALFVPTKSLDCGRAQAETSLAGQLHHMRYPMSKIPSGVKRSNKTKLNRFSSSTALAALLAVGLAAVGTAAPAVAQEKMTTPAPAEKKPNILVIMGDDVGLVEHRRVSPGDDVRQDAQSRQACLAKA